MKLPDKLYQLRKQRGLTLKELSEAVGITAAALSSYEKGQKEPSLSFAKKLAEYYCISLDELCGLENSISETKMGKNTSRADIVRCFTELCESGLPLSIESKFFDPKALVSRNELYRHALSDIRGISISIGSPWLCEFADKYERLLRLYIEGEIDSEILQAWKEKRLAQYANIQNIHEDLDDELPF